MTLTQTGFKDLVIIEPNVLGDSRGYFMEAYNANTLLSLGITANFVQDNQSKSGKGVFRGLHYQNAPRVQSKLIRVLSGVILDVALDLRRSEPTFGKVFIFELSDENKKQLFVPKGFAHGFVVLSEMAEILYKCDEFYNKASEGGILYNDPLLNIDWKIPSEKALISEKDKKHPSFAQAEMNF